MCCPPPDGARRIGYTTSSGVACAPTLTEAILAALLELVERDAVMLAWKCGLSLPLVDWSRDDELLELERRFFECAPLSYSVLDGSRFLEVPVAIGVLRGPPRSGTALAVGAGCAAHPRDAWLKALSECFGVRSWLIVQSRLHPDRPAPSADDVRTFGHHMAFYADDRNAELARFFDASSERTPIDKVIRLEGFTPREQIEAIVSRLARRGITAYAVDVSSPDVRELGLSVARVVAPELCTLDVPHRVRFLGGTRLYHGAHAAGYTSAPLSVADLNPLPHPFP
jgi:ribosomal protein S12 methylthiotransferase accessory factor